MLSGFVEFSIRFRGVTIALALVVLGYGLYVSTRSKLDVFPEFAPPLVVIQTEAPGLSPEEVEQLVTRPIEYAVNGVGNLDALRSQSIQGLSVVTAIFRDGTDIFQARQLLAERLVETAGNMPSGVKTPTLAPLTTSTSMIYTLGLTSTTRSLMDVRTFANWTLRPRLLGEPGVAKVAVFGGEVRQLQVQVRPERLIALELSIGDVIEAARRATGIRGAGFIENRNQRIVVHSEGQSLTPEEVGELIVTQRGTNSIRLRDVASVVEAPEPKVGEAAVMGESGVVLVVSSQLGANTLEVTQGIERAVDEMRPACDTARIVLHPNLFRAANFIETALHNIRFSLLLGGALVAIVLFLFLANLRTAFISLTAIPLSLLTAVILLDYFGITLNTLTLGGLAIAIGEVVDDAIIDVENIVRRLRENRAAGSGKPLLNVVLDASLEVRSAVVYATFIVALVFVPVLTMSGIQGRLFYPLGVAYILAIMASLVVAVTLTPALSMVMLKRDLRHREESRFVRWLKANYHNVLVGFTARPRTVIAAALLLCVAAIATFPFFGGTFLPELREGHFVVHMSAVPGTSLAESLRLGGEVTDELRKNSHVRSVCQRVGRAEQADDTWGPHYSEFNVDLVPLEGEEGEFVQSEIREALAKFSGVYFAIKPFLTERIEEVISGVTAQVAIRIFGDDLDVLETKAAEVAQVITQVPGAADVQIESPPGSPQVTVRLKRERLKQFGFHPLDLLDAIQTAYQGTVVGQTYDRNRVFDVSVLLDAQQRQAPEQIGSLMLRNEQGMLVPLRELADVFQETGRYVVMHDGTRRRTAVSCNVRGRDLASFVAEARRRVAETVTFPAGTYTAFGGAAEAQAAAQRELLLFSAIAGIGIVLLLAIAFNNTRNLLLVLVNLPFALVGGVLAVFFTGGWLTLGALVGFVTLFGISTRNSIMMISHFEHLVTKEGMTWGLDAALRGASERLTPILMTALVTALGLLPIAIGSKDPGREIEGPMAIVILGGLATSTALNLLVLPTLALRFGRFKPA